MNTRIQLLFLNFLQKYQLILEEDTILLAVSGGIDSIVMCDLFSKTHQKFAIAHCNFQLREQDSEDDEVFVKKLANYYQVPFFSKKFDTLKYADDEKVSTQMAARDLRYQWFDELLINHQMTKLATAHHQNDVLETVLLNLTRGTGIAGLHGILLQNQKIIRPLLFLTKKEILKYAEEHELKWREDISNQSTKYKRNLIRNEVVPLLRELNPNLEKTFNKSIQKIQSGEWMMNEYIIDFKKRAFFEDQDKIYINTRLLPENLHAVYLLFECIKKYNFTYQDCEDIIQSLNSSQNGLQFLSDSYQLIKNQHELIILPIIHKLSKEFQILEETNYLESNFGNINCQQIDQSELDFRQGNSILFFDKDQLKFPLIIRKWKNGDVFKPFGMKGKKKKLSDFLIDEKIPLHKKEEVEVLISDGEIIAILAYRMSEYGKIKSSTQNIIKIVYHKKEAL